MSVNSPHFRYDIIPNELTIKVLRNISLCECLFLIRTLPSSHRTYQCAVFLLLETVEIYCHGGNENPRCFEDIFEIKDESETGIDEITCDNTGPLIRIFCLHLPKILKYQSAIKKIVISWTKNKAFAWRPAISKLNLSIIRSFLGCCTRVIEVEQTCGFEFRYPKSTEILKILSVERKGEYYSLPKFGPSHINLSKINYSPNITKLHIRSIKFKNTLAAN
ncbi:hypothetical protein DASC09_025490 [Saccharomycopsis crataegensis]|uniref:F-box domain-containing protein n=1 Tax=Saccharomycopsis crataegensis TaxID=43959 RepID=A0AAV5QKT4_9ASCO|nr:hypothetical protein DASC09_025490 [Saccharomycopsis crataegensis]